MNRPAVDSADRLLAAEATDFERRLLEAAQAAGPSPAASARMARALGVTAGVAVTVGATKTLASVAAASKATAAGTSAASPWIAAGVIGLVAAGAVVGVRAWRGSRSEPLPAPPPVISPVQESPPPDEPIRQTAGAPTVEPAPSPVAAGRRTHPATAAPELREQIELLDAARASLSAGAARRALELLRRYEDRYPAGSFRPEATALRVEALVKLGRHREARALAQRFVAEHRGSLLADRVAKLADLSP